MNERTLFLGCDPGRTGGAVIINGCGVVAVCDLSKHSESEIATFLREYAERIICATIERVWMRTGDHMNVGKLIESYGFLRGLLAAFDIPRQEVTPQKWQSKLGVPGDDKPALRQFMSQRYPGTRWSNATAAAGCLAHYTYITHTRIRRDDTGDGGGDNPDVLAAATGEAVHKAPETEVARQLREWREIVRCWRGTELGNHSEFLGVMPMNDMLVRWFINDTADTGTWRLKGHARDAYWEWLSSWSRMAEHPRDLGDDVPGYDLPPMKIHRHQADSSDVKGDEGTLFAMPDVSATGIFKVKKQTAEARARMVAEIVSNKDPWLIWVDTDGEQDAVESILPKDSYLSVRGSNTIKQKESRIERWINGDRPVMISKSSIMGFGMNFQFCWQQVFAGRSFSHESWYQAVRRSWRFGQKHPVDIHIVVAEGEDSIGRVLDRKADDHADMKREMTAAMRRAVGLSSKVRRAYEPKVNGRLPVWL